MAKDEKMSSRIILSCGLTRCIGCETGVTGVELFREQVVVHTKRLLANRTMKDPLLRNSSNGHRCV